MRRSKKLFFAALMVAGAAAALLSPGQANAAREYIDYSLPDRVKALYLKLEDYPHPASPLGANHQYVDWPLRSQGCPAAEITGNNGRPTGQLSTLYKSVPWLPLISFARPPNGPGTAWGPIYGQSAEFFTGDNITSSGNCRDRYVDAGPGSNGENTSGGIWVDPLAYGRWGGGSNTPGASSLWPNALVNDQPGGRLPPDEVADGAMPLWGMVGNDNSPKDQILFPRNGVTSYTPQNGFRLYSNGSTLFRHEFNLTQQQVDTLNQEGSEFEIDIKADDWYRVYLNGTLQFDTVVTSQRNQRTFPSKQAFNVGTNVLAVQVIDKAVWYSQPITQFNRASGLAYALYISTPDYVLTPAITGNPSQSEGGDIINLTPSVNNGGVAVNNIDWQITRFVLNEGAPVPGAAQNSQLPQSYYGNGAQIIGSGNQTMPTGVTNISIDPQVLEEYDVGQRVCFTLSVRPYTTTPPVDRWSHGVPFCVTIAKQPKVQVWGGDLIVGKGQTSDIRTSTTRKLSSLVQPPAYNASMIQGLYPTGVSDARTPSGGWQKLPAGANDPHWTLTAITRSPSAASQPHCQLNAIPQAAKVVNLSQVNVGSNDAWRANPADSGWVGAYTNATNDGTGPGNGGCRYPGNSNDSTDAGTFRDAATWTFKLTNDFTIGGCVDPRSVQLRMQFSADDEAQIVVNGQVVTDFGEFRTFGNWPSDPVTYTTNRHPSAFRVGSNTLEIRVKSGWTYTGMLVGGNFTAVAECSRDSSARTTFGSWGEYAISASGSIRGMASGAGYSAGAADSLFCPVSLLTFTNAGSDICTPTSPKGGYSNSRTLPPLENNFRTTAALGANPTVNVANLNSGVYSASGTVTIATGGPGDITIPRGKWVVINARGADVVINSNIRYAGDPIQNIRDIPQLVIIANNIRIAGGVSQVDAWLMATGEAGNLVTCSDVANAAAIRANNCTNQLRVNGPVAAKHLYLYRTSGAGSGPSNVQAAEVFNLRPDAYLWATWYNSNGARLQTVRTTELPPRF